MSCLFSCPSSLLPPGPLLLHGPENQLNPGQASGLGAEAEVAPPTPDVDLLLECTFSYMLNSVENDGLEPEEEFLSPRIGPEEEEVGQNWTKQQLSVFFLLLQQQT